MVALRGRRSSRTELFRFKQHNAMDKVDFLPLEDGARKAK